MIVGMCTRHYANFCWNTLCTESSTKLSFDSVHLQQSHITWHTLCFLVRTMQPQWMVCSVCIRYLTQFSQHLKAYNQISPDPDREKTMLFFFLISDITSRYLPYLYAKILDKPLCRRVLDEDIDPINVELKQTLAYML